MSLSRLLLSQLASLALASFLGAATNDEPTLEQRLEKLAASLEEAREDNHIPGMSIAIVKDGEIVWARGFGLADVEAKRPADENTIFAVGSTTKSFTATLVGMLADEQKLTWDDPVTQHLPYFDLQVRSDDPNAECTLRDLLSHRHGFSRMGIVWINGQNSREEILRTAAGAEPWDDFRKGFHYCNVTYLAAGEAAGAAAASSWDELMMERIFEPLEMTSSTLTMAEARKDPRMARGYEWDKVDERFEPSHMIDINAVGPAGSVNSNVLDMAQWVRLQLGEGEVDGMQLISSQRLHETWEPQIGMGSGRAYGLGWMLQEYDGRKVVEHGGNIGGFSAQIGMIPEENLGYVMLSNIYVTPFQQGSLAVVFDALLGEWPEELEEEEATTVAEAVVETEIDYDEYTGLYIANFASFRDEEFEVLNQGDNLALDVPSQMTFELKDPDAKGRWTFAMTDTIAVSFDRDEEGTVVGLTMHQSPYTFEVPRKGVEIQPDVPVEELEKYVGTFVRVEGGKRVKLSIVRGRLTMEDKGNMLVFNTPDAEGHATWRARADQGATFNTDAEGSVDSFVFHGDAGDKLFTRLADSPDSELPTLDDVLALRNTDARVAVLKADGGTKATGKVWVPQAGVRGTTTVYVQGDRFANHLDFGKFGNIDIVSRDGKAWTYDPMRSLRALKGDELLQMLLAHPASIEGDWSAYFDAIEVVRNDTLRERPVHVLRLRKKGLPSRTYWVDAEHGDLLRVNQITIEGPIRIPVTTNFFDFEERDGVRNPTRVETENPESGRTVVTFDGFESGLDLGDDVFTLAAPEVGEASSGQ